MSAAATAIAGGGAGGASSGGGGGGPRHHILTMLVENRAGVLVRVASLFARRGFNIFSLAVAPTDDERFSRITIVVDVGGTSLAQIIHQSDKLVNVVDIEELDPTEACQRELLLVTVSAGADNRSQVIQLAGVFGAHVVDVGTDELTVELAGTPEQLDGFEDLMRDYGIARIQRSGRIALPKLVRGTGAAAGGGAAEGAA